MDKEWSGKIMTKQTITALLLATALTLSTAASADTRIIEVWNCKVLDGKTVEDVQAANKTWLAFVNGKDQTGGVQSYVVTSVVGDSTGFMFVDSYPNMAAWTTTEAALKTPEGLAVEATIIGVSQCTTNTLHESTES